MASERVNELLGSLKELFASGAYTDLKITCGNDQHQVHKAVVCPRSKLLAKLCSELSAKEKSLSLPDDDPKAIELMLHYLYTLDYPLVVSKAHESGGVNGLATNGAHHDGAKHATNGHITSPVILDYNVEKEQFEHASEAGSEFKKNRKKNQKKRNSTSANAAPNGADSASETGASLAATTGGTGGAASSSHLVTHARVYALGAKYGVAGLQSLAAEKFEREAGTHWHSDDFLGAAQEAYTSTATEDRTIRDVVLRSIQEHPELLDRAQARDAIKGLELAFDLMMHFKKNTAASPGAATAAPSTAVSATSRLRAFRVGVSRTGGVRWRVRRFPWTRVRAKGGGPVHW